jgi:hypothetical protein
VGACRARTWLSAARRALGPVCGLDESHAGGPDGRRARFSGGQSGRAREARLAAEEEAAAARASNRAPTWPRRSTEAGEEQASAAQRLRRRAVYLAGALVVAAVLAVLALGASRRASANAVAAEASAGQAATSEARAVANADLAADRQEEAEAERQIAVAARATAEAEALVRAAAEAEAVRERETAEEQTLLATSRELSLAALNTLSFDPELSILLALQAKETAYTRAAEDALHQAVQHSRLRVALPDVWAAALHPDGAHVATLDETNLRVWDLATERATLTVTLPADAFTISYSPDGQTIATGHADGRVILWEAASGAETRSFADHPGAVNSVAFSPDGRRLASADGEGVVLLRDLESGGTLFNFPGVVFWSSPVAFSPDGTLLAVPELAEDPQGSETALNLWDVESGRLRMTLGSSLDFGTLKKPSARAGGFLRCQRGKLEGI